VAVTYSVQVISGAAAAAADNAVYRLDLANNDTI
jgi:hypothetical protein